MRNVDQFHQHIIIENVLPSVIENVLPSVDGGRFATKRLVGEPGHIKDLIRRVNLARRDNPALQQLRNLEFLRTDSPNLLAYAKATTNGDNVLIIVVNLDPNQGQQGTVHVPHRVVGREPGATFDVHDLLSDQQFRWSAENYVYLDPARQPAHLLRVASL